MKQFLGRLAVVALLVGSLGGCAVWQKIETSFQAVTGAAVTVDAVAVAANSFDLAQATASKYLAFCKGSALSICAQSNKTIVVKAVYSGRTARNKLERFLREHPGELGLKGDYDALTAATGTIKSITDLWKS